jgi:tRNA pseudouridine32 synthase/23S rRNA pseudouridine746 synthase
LCFLVLMPLPEGADAAALLMASLRAGQIAPGLPASVLHGRDGGKMFGVLVVRSATGEPGYLKAFSGQLEHSWDVEGFVPPVFDRAARLAIEPRGEASVRKLTARVIEARDSPEWARARAASAKLDEELAAEEEALLARHRLRRAARRELPRSRELDFAAREDEMEHRRMKARLRDLRAPHEAVLAGFERKLRRVRQLRVAASRIVSWQLYDTYAFENRLGERRTLRELFAPKAPPSGAGDCAAPKLIVFALRNGLTPLALTEFWWGKTPKDGARAEGVCYPPCAEKCGTLLPFLLGQIDAQDGAAAREPGHEEDRPAVGVHVR